MLVALEFRCNNSAYRPVMDAIDLLAATRAPTAPHRREVYVQGAGRWQDPDEDLPGDFEDNRDVHYAELGKPLDAAEFIDRAPPADRRDRPGAAPLHQGRRRPGSARARDLAGDKHRPRVNGRG